MHTEIVTGKFPFDQLFEYTIITSTRGQIQKSLTLRIVKDGQGPFKHFFHNIYIYIYIYI